jgi:hypothetical protein
LKIDKIGQNTNDKLSFFSQPHRRQQLERAAQDLAGERLANGQAIQTRSSTGTDVQPADDVVKLSNEAVDQVAKTSGPGLNRTDQIIDALKRSMESLTGDNDGRGTRPQDTKSKSDSGTQKETKEEIQ